MHSFLKKLCNAGNLIDSKLLEPILIFDSHSPWSKGKNWLFGSHAKRGNFSKTRKAMPTKIGLHQPLIA